MNYSSLFEASNTIACLIKLTVFTTSSQQYQQPNAASTAAIDGWSICGIDNLPASPTVSAFDTESESVRFV